MRRFRLAYAASRMRAYSRGPRFIRRVSGRSAPLVDQRLEVRAAGGLAPDHPLADARVAPGGGVGEVREVARAAAAPSADRCLPLAQPRRARRGRSRSGSRSAAPRGPHRRARPATGRRGRAGRVAARGRVGATCRPVELGLVDAGAEVAIDRKLGDAVHARPGPRSPSCAKAPPRRTLTGSSAAMQAARKEEPTRVRVTGMLMPLRLPYV